MYLSRVPLDLSKRKTQIALASPNKFHGAVEEAFSGNRERNLWRIDTLKGKTYLMILSVSKPDLSSVAEQFGGRGACGETREYDGFLDRIKEGSVWHFRLTANPVHSIKTESGRGKVVAHITEKYQLEWLERQAEKKGFRLLPDTVCVRESNWKIFSKHNSRQKVRLLEVTFEGILQVEDVDAFKNSLLYGIGRGKAYGMGLLTIAGTGA